MSDDKLRSKNISRFYSKIYWRQLIYKCVKYYEILSLIDL